MAKEKKQSTAAKKTAAITKKTSSKKAAPAKKATTAKKVAPAKKAKPVDEKVDTSTTIKEDVVKPVSKESTVFDWDAFEAEETDSYSKDERSKLNDMYDGTLTQIEEKSLIQGTVIAITKKEVVININYPNQENENTTRQRRWSWNFLDESRPRNN